MNLFLKQFINFNVLVSCTFGSLIVDGLRLDKSILSSSNFTISVSSLCLVFIICPLIRKNFFLDITTTLCYYSGFFRAFSIS